MTENHPATPINRTLPGAAKRVAVLAVVLAILFIVAGGNTDRRVATGAQEIRIASQGSGEVSGDAGADSGIQPDDAMGDRIDRERQTELAVGAWEDDYQGKRTMHLRADGTGTMIVELSGWKAKLFAERLEFDMVWSVEEGRMQKRTVGGRPETTVRMILKMMGDRVDEPILELTEDRLLLLDADGQTQYDWRRVSGP